VRAHLVTAALLLGTGTSDAAVPLRAAPDARRDTLADVTGLVLGGFGHVLGRTLDDDAPVSSSAWNETHPSRFAIGGAGIERRADY